MSQIVTREHHPDRYQLTVDGVPAGFAEFVDVDGQRIFFHTEVPEAFSGQGLAAVIVRQALDATRAEGLRVVPVCPYVKQYVRKHDDWADIVDPVTPAALQAIPRR